MEGKASPCLTSNDKYVKPIADMLEGMKRQDPASIPQLAVPVAVPNWLVETGQTAIATPKTQAIGDLAAIAFYYLLRVGEYTYRDEKKRTRTQQFRVKDVHFWTGTEDDMEHLPRDAPMEQLLQASGATMRISNQKNGTRGQLIYHEATGDQHCPIRALARRVGHIRQHTSDENTMLGTHFDKRGYKKFVYSDDIVKSVRLAATALNLTKKGLHPSLLGSHSLRSGGAMAMKLNGEGTDTIRKCGRWSSDTFLMCIHEQISALGRGLSKRMATPTPFFNIAGPTLLDAQAFIRKTWWLPRAPHARIHGSGPKGQTGQEPRNLTGGHGQHALHLPKGLVAARALPTQGTGSSYWGPPRGLPGEIQSQGTNRQGSKEPNRWPRPTHAAPTQGTGSSKSSTYPRDW